jgi:hypothetical protein
MRKGAAMVVAAAIVPAGALADISRPAAGPYVGKTSTQGPAKLTVTAKRNAVRALSIRVLYKCASNSGTVRETFTRKDPVRLRSGRFTIHSGYITVKGRFTSRTRARGTISVEHRLSPARVCRGEQCWTASLKK